MALSASNPLSVLLLPINSRLAIGRNCRGGEYGFWANVNPDVPHPRWSQATERLLGTGERVPTQLYNGYAEECAHSLCQYAPRPHVNFSNFSRRILAMRVVSSNGEVGAWGRIKEIVECDAG